MLCQDKFHFHFFPSSGKMLKNSSGETVELLTRIESRGAAAIIDDIMLAGDIKISVRK